MPRARPFGPPRLSASHSSRSPRLSATPGTPAEALRQADPGFLATAFMELAATVQPVPEDVAAPPADRSAPPPADRLARDVVDLFLRGAAPDHA
ncbi:hypothetical protein AB0O72_12345 [Streptomyces sp. NPDC088106]|uniref:hypothetical protein n=1 Tax=Streptomyces sp. NPDC088106 TaxID=3154867 RepID=UPI0034351F92